MHMNTQDPHDYDHEPPRMKVLPGGKRNRLYIFDGVNKYRVYDSEGIFVGELDLMHYEYELQRKRYGIPYPREYADERIKEHNDWGIAWDIKLAMDRPQWERDLDRNNDQIKKNQ
jgi:hypothetical protein